MNSNFPVSIYIPCYNCAPQLVRAISRMADVDLSWVQEIVFIDNCSSDNSQEVIRQQVNKIDHDCLLISHQENYGLGGSFKTAIEHAKANNSHMIWFHGDDQARPDELNKLRPYLEQKADVVFGSRFTKESKLFNYSKARTIGNQLINGIYSLFLGRRIYELGSGLNMYRLDSLPLKELEFWPNHIAFDANLLFHFIRNKKEISWMPISWHEKDQVSNARNFQVAYDLIKMLLTFRLKGKTITNNNNVIKRTFKIEQL